MSTSRDVNNLLGEAVAAVQCNSRFAEVTEQEILQMLTFLERVVRVVNEFVCANTINLFNLTEIVALMILTSILESTCFKSIDCSYSNSFQNNIMHVTSSVRILLQGLMLVFRLPAARVLSVISSKMKAGE